MSKEKYIHGKIDEAKHCGLYSTRKREQESEDQLLEAVEELGLKVRIPNRVSNGKRQKTSGFPKRVPPVE